MVCTISNVRMNIDMIIEFAFEKKENIVGKGENAGL